MRRNEHIREEERIKIEAWLQAEWTQERIAKKLKRPQRTLEKELARNGGAAGYRAGVAQMRAVANRKKPRRKSKLAFGPLVALIQRRLERKISPELISLMQARKHAPGSNRYISHQQLYRVIRARQKAGDTGWSSLLPQAHRRFRRRNGQSRYGRIHNTKSIHQRPVEADQRARVGDVESDSFRIRGQQGGLATHVDRRTRYLVIARLKDKSARSFNAATKRAFARAPFTMLTMTVDHGMENASFAVLEKDLNIAVHFADAHHPQQRGSNENINGQLRAFFPKHRRFETVTKKQIDEAAHSLNHRPRKMFGCLSSADRLRLESLRLVQRGAPPFRK